MTEEQERAAFEAWRRSTTKMSPDDAVARDGIGELSEYENRTTRAMWIGWKGRALAALSQPASPASIERYASDYLKEKRTLAEEIAAYHRARLARL